jgi:hypothetical protein
VDLLSRKIPDRISDFVLGVILSFSLVYALESSLHIDCDRLGLLTIISVIMAAYYVLFLKKLSVIITAGILGGCILLSAVTVTIAGTWGRVDSLVKDYFNWLSEFITYPVNRERLYLWITLLSLCIFLTLLIYIFAVRFFIYPVLLAAGAALFCIQWIYNYIIDFTPFYIYIFIIVMYYFKYIHKKRSGTGENNYISSTGLLFGLLPVCAMVVFVAAVLHASDKPIEWKWMDDRVNAIADFFEDKYNYSVFNYHIKCK